MLTCLAIGCLGLIGLVVLAVIGIVVFAFAIEEEDIFVKETPVIEGACQQGEVFDEQEQVCMLEIACTGTVECSRWGDDVIGNLESTYGPLDEFTYADDEVIKEQIVEEYVIANNVVLGDIAEEYLWQWQSFDWLTPDEYTTMIDYVEVFEGNETNAYVKVAGGTSATLGLNMEKFLASETIQNTVHELAHLFTLRPDQVDYSVTEEACDTLYTEEQGCFYESSYMYQFYEQFWLPGTAEANWDDYINDYAMTHEQEDFAESFTYFVLYPAPEGERLVDEKLRFFNQFDEMVTLRAELLSRIATWLPRTTT